MTQEELAGKLGKPQSYVAKIEAGQRRLDIIELRAYCNAIGLSLGAFVRTLERTMGREFDAVRLRGFLVCGARSSEESAAYSLLFRFVALFCQSTPKLIVAAVSIKAT